MGRQRQIAKLGNKTTKGHIVSASSTILDGRDALVVNGDKAWCDVCKDSFEINATYTGFTDVDFLVGDGDQVLCYCKDNYVIAISGYTGHSSPERKAFSTPANIAPSSSFPDIKEAVSGVPVFAKSILRGTGNADAGTAEEPQTNIGEMSFYQSSPSQPALAPAQHAQAAKKKTPPPSLPEPPKKKSLFDKVTGFKANGSRSQQGNRTNTSTLQLDHRR